MSFDRLRQDIRIGARSLRRAPAFALTAVAALALGLGATTAILSVVNGVLLRPLPYANADRLVVILHEGRNPVAPANYIDWRDQTNAFSAMGAAEAWSPDITGTSNAEEVSGLHMTASLLPMLGVRPLIGRWYTAAEEESSARVVVISHALWQRRFAGSANAVGSTVSLNSEPYTILGVMPPAFRFAPFWMTNAELWAPLSLGARAASRTGQSLRIFARLAPGVSIAGAQAELDGVTERLERMYPGTNRAVQVVPLRDKVVGDIRGPLRLLFGAVLLVLLIACANVAHMLLARGSARAREMAVRTALGAAPGTLATQLLVESGLLAAAGAAAGLGIAWLSVRMLSASGSSMIPRVSIVAIDPRVVAMTFALAGATTLLFGLAPALYAAGVDPASSFRSSGRNASDGVRGQRLRDALMVSEFAFALMLLVGAVLLARSFVALRHVDPGFDPSNLVTMRVSTTGTPAADSARHAAFYEQTLERLRALPTIESASYINHLPIAGDAWGTGFRVEGRPAPAHGDWPRAIYRVVMPGYFATMRIPLLRGRDVDARDRLDAVRVVVINQFMAEQYWPGADPLGKRLTFDDSTWATVIGVAKNTVRQEWSAPPEEELFLPFLQSPSWMKGGGASRSMTLVARVRCATAECDPTPATGEIRRAIVSTQANVPLSAVQTMREVVDRATSDAQLYFALLGAFSLVAVSLAAVGVFGVMSYSVARRRQEIGIRIALGAEPGSVVRLVVGRALRLAGIGIAAGVALTALAAPLLRGLLYGVAAQDPLGFALSIVVLTAVAVLGSIAPARHAARIDPLTAMRAE